MRANLPKLRADQIHLSLEAAAPTIEDVLRIPPSLEAAVPKIEDVLGIRRRIVRVRG